MKVAERTRPRMNLPQLLDAMADANIPTLVPVLYQLTGDRKWLSERYRPERTRALGDNPTGGLSGEVQAELRGAVAEAVMRWAAGAEIAVPAPTSELLIELMSICMGEDIPAEYEPMTAEEMGFRRSPVRKVESNPCAFDSSILIIGAGVSGLTMSRDLTRAGIKHTIFERNLTVGGAWVNNPYPGCGVDTPSYLYSFSFYPRDWSRHYAQREELETYLRDMAADYDLLKNIRFGMDVVSCHWDDAKQNWDIVTRTADRNLVHHQSKILITAVGILNEPKFPDIAGLDSFTGRVFHSARWPADIEIQNKRVGVVGTGASAMQIVPAIVDEVEALGIFQRSPQWIAPCETYFTAVSTSVHYLMKHVPFYYEWYRFRLGWTNNDKVFPSLQKDPLWTGQPGSINQINEGHRRYFERYLRKELDGRPDLVEKAIPAYPPFGKRMLLDNGWFTSLKKKHVELITEAVVALTDTSIVTAGGLEWPADVVVLATGYEAQRPTYPIEIVGRTGMTLRDAWEDDNGRAYMGFATPSFPNLFFLYGPNTSLGHGGSFIFLAERAAKYLTDLLCKLIENGIDVIEVSEDANNTYNAKVDEAHHRMIWTQQGFSTWYTNSRGRVVTNMPWRVVDWWKMTQRADLEPYKVHVAASESA